MSDVREGVSLKRGLKHQPHDASDLTNYVRRTLVPVMRTLADAGLALRAVDVIYLNSLDTPTAEPEIRWPPSAAPAYPPPTVEQPASSQFPAEHLSPFKRGRTQSADHFSVTGQLGEGPTGASLPPPHSLGQRMSIKSLLDRPTHHDDVAPERTRTPRQRPYSERHFPAIVHVQSPLDNTSTFPARCTSCSSVFPTNDELRAHQSRGQCQSEQPPLAPATMATSASAAGRSTWWQRGNEPPLVESGDQKGILSEPSGSAEEKSSPLDDWGSVKPYHCPDCNLRFESGSLLVDHRFTAHGITAKFPCESCGRDFGYNHQLNKHRADEHRGPKPFHCDLCDTRFERNADLNKHIDLVHKKTKRYKCPEPGCGKSFGLKVGATRHFQTVHLKRRNFLCKICGIPFGTNSNLTKHMGRKHPKALNDPALDHTRTTRSKD